MTSKLKILIAAFGALHLGVWAILYSIFSLSSIKAFRIKYHDYVNLLILSIICIFMIATQVLIGNRELDYIMKNLFPILILFLHSLATSPPRKYVIYTFNLISILLFTEFIINMTALFFNIDLLGRELPPPRPGDWSLRFLGLFGHPFISAGLSITGLILAFSQRSYLFISIGAINLILNASLRAPLAFCLLICIAIGLKIKLRISIFMVLLPIYWMLVVYVTFISVGTDDFITGNALRIIAWSNAISNILEEPIFGMHNFISTDVHEMNADTIVLSGTAESNLLQLWLDYGIVPMVGLLVFFLRNAARDIKYYAIDRSYMNFSRSLLSVFLLYDLLFGSYYGTPFMLLLIWIMKPDKDYSSMLRKN